MTPSILLPKTPTWFSRLLDLGENTNQSPSSTQPEASSFEHPSGPTIFYHEYIVSFQRLTDIHISIANHILGECDPEHLADVKDRTVSLHISGAEIEYYVVDHKSKMILWTIDQVPEPFNNADSSKHEYEYWVHMRNFPGHRLSTSEDYRLLQDILNNSPLIGSTGMRENLKVEFAGFERLNPINQTYTVATVWLRVLQQSGANNVDENNRVLINNDMPVSKILEHISTRVKDVEEQLDLLQCDKLPTISRGYGDVYFGRLQNGTRVAIKCLRLKIDQSPGGHKHIEAFSNELYAWWTCNHPNVLGLIGMAKYRGQLAMVSPWMQNGNLEQFLSTRVFSQKERYHLCSQIVEGVAYLHENKIVHGDLKAENILVSDEGVLHLTDFGSSIIREHSLQFRSSGLDRAFTLRWVAAERLGDKAKPTYSSDIHSLGMTILEVITGDRPYADAHQLAVFGKVISGVLPNRPERHMPTGDNQADYLWSILTTDCWARKPEDRITAALLRDKMRSGPFTTLL